MSLPLLTICLVFFQACSSEDAAVIAVTKNKPGSDATITDICRKWEWSRKGKIGAVDDASGAVFHPGATGDDIGKYLFVSNFGGGDTEKFSPAETEQATAAGKDAKTLLQGLFFTKINEYVYETGMTEEQKDAVTALTDETEQYVKLNLTNTPSCGATPVDVESMFVYNLNESGVTNSYLVLVESNQWTIVKVPALSTLKAGLKTTLKDADASPIDAEVVKVLKWKLADPGLSGFDERLTRAAMRACSLKPSGSLAAVDLTSTALTTAELDSASVVCTTSNIGDPSSTSLTTAIALDDSSKVYVGSQAAFSVSLSKIVSQDSCSTLESSYKGRMPVEFIVAAMVKGLKQLMALAGGKLDANLYYNTETQNQFKLWIQQYADIRETLLISPDDNLRQMGEALDALVDESLVELYDKIDVFEASGKNSTYDDFASVLSGIRYDKSHIFGFLVPSEMSYYKDFVLYGTFGGMIYGHMDLESLPTKTSEYMQYFQKVSNRTFLLPYRKKYQTSLIQPEIAMFGQGNGSEMITIGERRPNVIKGMSKLNNYLDDYGRIKDEGDTTTVFSAKCVDKK